MKILIIEFVTKFKNNNLKRNILLKLVKISIIQIILLEFFFSRYSNMKVIVK